LTSGYIRVKATRIGEDTIIAQIIETVKEAESMKPRLARLADRIVGYFTWIVIAIAVFTLLYWVFIHSRLDLGVLFTASVLVIACPCALGIAIPLVISIAVLKLSRKGIVTRTGDLFERILLTNTIIFDKTGTLTIGEPSIISIHKLKQIDDKELMELVCAIEKRSEHPVGKSMLKYCNSIGINAVEPDEFVNISGEGVYGVVGGHSVGIGNLEIANRLGVKIDNEIVKAINEIGLRGNTSVLVIVDNEVIALMEIGDKLREGVSHVIKELKKDGYYIGLASGDSESNVKYYKDLLSLDFAYWGMKPRDKALLIKELQSKGFKIIFVGDGVNDAPALSVADVGIAMGRGSDLSKEAGDVILISNNLGDLVYLMKFSRIVRRKMIQNLLWAFIYNASLIPIAMGSLYPKLIIYPELAAVVMVLSDISVVLNAMALFKYK
jgi:ATPase, P-type (transporting), HAD superfamily, subfamily IC/heavy metal translocating P-type ATPase